MQVTGLQTAVILQSWTAAQRLSRSAISQLKQLKLRQNKRGLSQLPSLASQNRVRVAIQLNSTVPMRSVPVARLIVPLAKSQRSPPTVSSHVKTTRWPRQAKAPEPAFSVIVTRVRNGLLEASSPTQINGVVVSNAAAGESSKPTSPWNTVRSIMGASQCVRVPYLIVC
jgi:hypothetical protein